MLDGGDGNDIITGCIGDDVIAGGFGIDILSGGSGANKFIYSSSADSLTGSGRRDQITDFQANQGDRINLSAIDGNSMVAVDQALSWLGSASFSGKLGQLRFGSGLLQADLNGDRIADFEITFGGVASFGSAQIIL